MESKPGGFQINVNEIMALKMVPLLFCLCRGCVWWLNKPLCLVIQPLVQALFVRLLSSHSGGTAVQSLWYVTVNPAVQ